MEKTIVTYGFDTLLCDRLLNIWCKKFCGYCNRNTAVCGNHDPSLSCKGIDLRKLE